MSTSTIITALPEIITTTEVAEINSVVDDAILSVVKETKPTRVPAGRPAFTAQPEPRAWSRVGNVD